MMDENKLISLKEAAKISGYSSDYIGQLIRSGKIPGKQVYTNISWMTTAHAIIEYKNNSERNKDKKDEHSGVEAYLKSKKRVFLMEFDIFKLFFKTFKSSLPIILVIVVSFALLLIYFFNYLYNVSVDSYNKNKIQKQNEQILF